MCKEDIQKYVCWGGEGAGGGGRSLKSEQKQTGAGSPSMCVGLLLKKNAEIFKMKFYGYSPVFPFDYNGSMKY